MASVRGAVYRLRKRFLTLAGIALAIGILLGLGILANRLAHHVTGFAEVVGLVILGALVLAVLCARLGTSVPSRAVIELDLSSLPAEVADASPLASLRPGSRALTLRETVEGLERAARDKRVAGLLVHATFQAAGMARVQELRDAITAFRQSGKFAVAFSDTFGELGGGNASYYLATACDTVILQTSGELGFIGLAGEATFVRGALDRIGVQPLFEGRHEYKSAASQLLERAFSDPEREQLQRIIDSQFGQIVSGVAQARGMTPDVVSALVDRGPLLAQEALDARLVDRVAYRDEVIDLVKEKAGEGSSLLYLSKYAKATKRGASKRGATPVALITSSGAIVRRHSAVNPFTGTQQIDAVSTSAAIRAAVDDKRTKAILVRVDSPGGSAVASDTIWRELVVAQQKGKPVVVSMGDVAASGGYYIAAGADRIVAQPGTITGSIGVVSGKPVIAEAKTKLSLTVDEVHVGEHSRIRSLNRTFTESEHERFSASLDAVYDEFVRKVSDGRKLSRERVHEVARGRIWTGEDAAERGLVDALGGYPVAVQMVREVVGLEADAPIRFRPFPKKRSGLAALRPPSGDSSDDQKGMLAAVVALVAAAGRVARRAGVLTHAPGSLHMGSEAEDWFIR